MKEFGLDAVVAYKDKQSGWMTKMGDSEDQEKEYHWTETYGTPNYEMNNCEMKRGGSSLHGVAKHSTRSDRLRPGAQRYLIYI